MVWKKKSCPRCGNNKITFEVEGKICFQIDSEGQVDIVSTPDDLVEVVETELSEYGAWGYCDKCGYTFKG